jgi:serine-type D-Ala-D-Ala carboxypeptidase/endopeptidase
MNPHLRQLSLFGAALAVATIASATQAEDKLLEEAVQFKGAFVFLGAKVPGLIFGAVRNGETAFAGFGKTADGSSKEPNGDSLFRIGSVSKAFCGTVLAALVAAFSVFRNPLASNKIAPVRCIGGVRASNHHSRNP